MASQVLVASQRTVLISISRVEAMGVAAGRKCVRTRSLSIRLSITPQVRLIALLHDAAILAHLDSICSHRSVREDES
jgi:hypothetical protein